MRADVDHGSMIIVAPSNQISFRNGTRGSAEMGPNTAYWRMKFKEGLKLRRGLDTKQVERHRMRCVGRVKDPRPNLALLQSSN
jgi:hypothetical protein